MNRINNAKNDTATAATDPGTMTLEQKIVAVLSDHTAEAHTIADLITETEKGIDDATVIAERLQQIALDPEQSPDLAQAREAAEFATLIVRRLNNILPRLQEAHHRIANNERATRWNATADKVEAKRDALAADFTNLYPQIISGMLDLFKQVQAMDAEVDRVNAAAPNAESRRLLPVADHSLIQLVITNTKLVDLSNKQVWPPPQPPILPKQVMTLPPHPGKNWWQANQERDAERYAESRRVAAYYANQQKAREEREAAEARAARAAHLRNGGMP